MTDFISDNVGASIDFSSILARYPNHWQTVHIPSAGFLILKDNGIIPITDNAMLAEWHRFQFPDEIASAPVPDGIKPDHGPSIRTVNGSNITTFGKVQRAVGLG